MPTSDQFASIADGTKPNAGRIYDYLLGGSHNFEVDRQAALPIVQLLPSAARIVRLIRWFLGEAVRRMCDEGFRYFLDFASGLPTVDHIHHVAPKGSRVIYSDLDPVTVAYGQEIVKDDPNIRYLACNAATPENILNSAELADLFGNTRKVAIGFNGIAWFLSDEDNAHALRTLYDWAAPGSRLFLTDNDASSPGKDVQGLMDIYKNMGQPWYPRSVETLKKLAHPWRLTEPGSLPLEEWVGLATTVSTEFKKTTGTGGITGSIFEK